MVTSLPQNTNKQLLHHRNFHIAYRDTKFFLIFKPPTITNLLLATRTSTKFHDATSNGSSAYTRINGPGFNASRTSCTLNAATATSKYLLLFLNISEFQQNPAQNQSVTRPQMLGPSFGASMGGGLPHALNPLLAAQNSTNALMFQMQNAIQQQQQQARLMEEQKRQQVVSYFQGYGDFWIR
jgi:hypothetical protein